MIIPDIQSLRMPERHIINPDSVNQYNKSVG